MTKDDARRAVVALLSGQTTGTFSKFSIRESSYMNQPSVELRDGNAGWAIAIEVGCLVWWRSYRYVEGHQIILNVIEDMLGELPETPAAHDEAVSIILGPLGLAAWRAAQTTTVG